MVSVSENKKWLFKIEYDKRPATVLSMPGGVNQIRVGYVEAPEEVVEKKILESIGNDYAHSLQYWKITGDPGEDSYGVYKSKFE